MTTYFEHQEGVKPIPDNVVEFKDPGDTGQFKCINKSMIVEEVEMTDEIKELFNV